MRTCPVPPMEYLEQPGERAMRSPERTQRCGATADQATRMVATPTTRSPHDHASSANRRHIVETSEGRASLTARRPDVWPLHHLRHAPTSSAAVTAPPN